MRKLYSGAALSLLALQGVPGVTAAQSEAEAFAIEEVVVTAQKRSENLQKVPISIYALTGDTIEKAGITDVYDMATFAPSFTTDNVGPADPTFTIRGIGSNDRGAGSDRSVVVFLDDVYIGRSSGTVFELYDIERVEVLRGPQGTLSGRNVVGGAINIITKTPTEEFTARAEATLGNFNLRQAKGSVSGALTENVAAGFSFTSRDRDGYYTYKPTGRDIDGVNSTNIRSKLAIKANDNLNIVLSADASRFRQDGISRKPYPVGSFLTDTLGFTPDPDPWVIESERPGYAEIDLWGLSARADWTTDIGVVTSITGFRHVHANSGQNSIGLPEGYFRSFYFADENSDFFSQELRLSSLPENDQFSWVFGVYYLNESVNRLEGYDRDLLGATSNPIYDEDHTTESISGFGQITYKLTEKLNITAGARYTHDKKSMDNSLRDGSNGTSTNGLAPGLAPFDISVSETFSSFTPKLTIDFSPTEDVLLYATVSKGFKSGGFQGLAPNGVAAQLPFRPEVAWNYEIGTKTRWMDNRLQVNLAGFYMDYTDLQISNRILTIPGDEASALRVLTNASDAEIKGIEAEILATPVRGLTLSGSYTYLDTEVVNFILGTDGTDLSGNRLAKSPKHAYTLSGTYVVDLEEDSDLTFYVSYAYRGNMYFFIENRPGGLESSYGLLNARATYRKDNWSLSVWGRNITDELYRTSAVVVGNTTSFSDFGDPATYGVTLGYDF